MSRSEMLDEQYRSTTNPDITFRIRENRTTYWAMGNDPALQVTGATWEKLIVNIERAVGAYDRAGQRLSEEEGFTYDLGWLYYPALGTEEDET